MLTLIAEIVSEMISPIDKPVVCPITVGRERYLDLLDGIVARVGDGAGQTVLVAGEAGVGKSRMVAEVKARATARGLLILQGNCFETDRSLPYAPILDMLRALLSRHGPQEVALYWEPFAPELVKLLPELQARIPGLLPSASLEPEQEKRRLFDAICGFFNELSLVCRLLVVVEDLHWTDDTSLDFLLYLARRIVDKPVLFLTTYRSDEARPLSRFLATLDRERLAAELRLDRLPINDVDTMMRAIFELQRPMRGEFLDTIYSLTEGNAFFIEEVLKSLISSGGIFYENGSWERKPMQELHIPRSVHDAVQRRTTGLGEEAGRTLALAAVVGRRFDFPLLQALTGYDELSLLAVIKELIGAQLVIEETVDRFAFRHALTRSAVYSDLLARERKALHRTIAEAIQTVYADSLDMQVADLAYHCYEAGMWAEALDYSRRAGENAQALYSPKAAIEQFTRAIEAAQKLGAPAPASLHRARGLEYETLGDFEQARSEYETVLSLARMSGDVSEEWQALLDLGKLWAGRDYARTGGYFRQALDLARTLNNPATLAHSLNRVGNWYANIDQPYDAVPMHREALDIFDTLDDKLGTAESLDLLGMTTYLSGDLVRGADCYKRAIQLFTELNDKQGLCSSLAMLPLCSAATYHTDTLVGVPLSEIDGVVECLQALDLARDIGWKSGEAFSLWMLGFCLGMRGNYGVALGYAEAAFSCATEIEHSQWMTASGGSLGTIHTDILALGRAREILERSITLARETGSYIWIRTISGFLASCCIAQGDYDRAQEALDTAMPEGIPCQTFGQRRCWQARAELAIGRGEYEVALDIIDLLYSNVLSVANEPNLSIPRLGALRGEALMLLGRYVEAEQCLQDALPTAVSQLSSSLVWRIYLLLGKVYRGMSRPDESERALAQSRALVEQLAATIPDEELRTGYLQSASALFPQAIAPVQTGVTRRAAAGTWAGSRAVSLKW